MNYRIVSYYLGVFSFSICPWLALSALWCFWYGEYHELAAFGESILTVMIIAAFLMAFGWKAPKRLYQRESVALVGLGWLIVAFYGALPFMYSGLLSFADAYFESMSGFTTTGSSVIPVLEPVAKSLLFWRAFTHWLGGLGIVMLIVLVLPFIGTSGKLLCKTEATGVDKDGLRPRIKETATILYKIYIGLTIIQTSLLMAAGMSLFDALCHTFACLATGGFGNYTDSIAHFKSVPIEIIITTFSLIGATNFALYYAMAKGDWKALFKNTEWKVFMGIYWGTTFLIVLNMLGGQATVSVDKSAPGAMGGFPGIGFWTALRYASFEVGTMMTNCGFYNADLEVFPYFSRLLIMIVTIMGGCAGSTAGGLKTIRVIILAKIARIQLQRTFRPYTIRALRVNGFVISDEVQYVVLSYFFIYIAFFTFSVLVLSFLGLPLQTAFSAVVACLNNTGPGLEYVGPLANFAFLTDFGKLFLSLVMVVGRLEFFSILVFFVPSFWRRG